MFRRKIIDLAYAYILVYVDGLFVFVPIAKERSATLEELKKLYELRVEDRVKLSLCVELTRNIRKRGQVRVVKLRHSRYIKGMLRRFGLHKSNPAPSCMVESFLSSLAA